VPVPHEAKAILEALDGQTTLKEIEADFGAEGLRLTAVLAERGVIELR